jgi:hypothetical protein
MRLIFFHQEYMRTLLHSSCTSSVSVSDVHLTMVCQFILGTNEKKQTSYKVLMGLIVLMFALDTIVQAFGWYITWVGFIYYDNTPEQALDALENQGGLSLLIAGSTSVLLTTLKMAIADGIMVSTHLSLPASPIDSLQLKRSGGAGLYGTEGGGQQLFL